MGFGDKFEIFRKLLHFSQLRIVLPKPHMSGVQCRCGELGSEMICADNQSGVLASLSSLSLPRPRKVYDLMSSPLLLSLMIMSRTRDFMHIRPLAILYVLLGCSSLDKKKCQKKSDTAPQSFAPKISDQSATALK